MSFSLCSSSSLHFHSQPLTAVPHRVTIARYTPPPPPSLISRGPIQIDPVVGRSRRRAMRLVSNIYNESIETSLGGIAKHLTQVIIIRLHLQQKQNNTKYPFQFTCIHWSFVAWCMRGRRARMKERSGWRKRKYKVELYVLTLGPRDLIWDVVRRWCLTDRDNA